MKRLQRLLLVSAVAVTAFTAQAAPLTVSNSTFGIADNSSFTRALAIGAGTVSDVNISIDFAKCADIAMESGNVCPPLGQFGNTEEVAGEIFFYLISPTGTRVDLVIPGTYSNVGSFGGRYQVTYDDEAGSPLGPNLSSGSFKPVELLSLFDGEAAAGNWTLHIGDNGNEDPLSYFSATLAVEVRDRFDVPEPGTLALTGMALLAAGALRRRRA